MESNLAEEFGQFLKKCYHLRNNDSLPKDRIIADPVETVECKLGIQTSSTPNENSTSDQGTHRALRIMAPLGQMLKSDHISISLPIPANNMKLSHHHYTASIIRNIIPHDIFNHNVIKRHPTHLATPNWNFNCKFSEFFRS